MAVSRQRNLEQPPYADTLPDCVCPVFDALSAQLQTHCRIRLHAGKPRVWNASGREPPNIRALGSGSDPLHHCLGGPAGRPRVCCGSVASAPCQTGKPVASHPYHPRPPVRLVATLVLRCPSLWPRPSHAAPLLDGCFRGLAR